MFIEFHWIKTLKSSITLNKCRLANLVGILRGKKESGQTRLEFDAGFDKKYRLVLSGREGKNGLRRFAEVQGSFLPCENKRNFFSLFLRF